MESDCACSMQGIAALTAFARNDVAQYVIARRAKPDAAISADRKAQ
ncbi:hypothetical protein [Pumilibacter intestinalis]|nr:hypothetical protein [Pumilibacter intestinalis]